MSLDGAVPLPPPPGTYRSQILLEQAQVVANGVGEAIKVAAAFVPQLQALRALLKASDLDFTPERLAEHIRRSKKRELPRDIVNGVSENVLTLQNRYRELIQWMADTVESYDYRDREEAAKALHAANTKAIAVRLVSAEKALNVSARAFKITNQLLATVNGEIRARLDLAQGDEERELLFANAILVHEMADFMVKYLENFQVGGMAQLEALYREVSQTTSSGLSEVAAQREQLKKTPTTDSMTAAVRSKFETEYTEHEAGFRVIQADWDSYFAEKSSVATTLRKRVDDQLQVARLRRESAKTRIKLLGLAAITSLIGDTLVDLQQAFEAFSDADMAALTIDRMHRLVGFNAARPLDNSPGPAAVN